MNNLHRIFTIIFVIALALSACSNSSSSNENHFVISMKRLLCHGTCPVYQLVIYSDGTVYYTGTANVATAGKVTSKLNQNDIERLFQEITLSDVLNRNGCCGFTVKGPSPVELIVTLDGKLSSLFFLPGEKNVPQELNRFQCMIDEITNSYQWTGKDRSFCDKILDN